MRGREYERDGPEETFMRDGFDRWAESDAPFRAGGSSKTPADRSSLYRRSLRSHRLRVAPSRGRGHPSDGEDYDNCSEDGQRFVGGRRLARSRSRSRSSSRSSRSSRSSFYSDSEDDGDFRGGQVAMPTYTPPQFKAKKDMKEKCDDGWVDQGMMCMKPGGMSGGSKAMIEKAFDLWYNYKFNINPFASASSANALAEKSSVPQELKNVVNKFKEMFDFLVGNMSTIKSVLKRAGLSSAVKLLEDQGFGRHGRRKLRYVVKHVVRRMKGGTNYVDMAESALNSSLGKTACNFNDTTKQACAGVNKALTIYKGLQNNKDTIRKAIDVTPGISSSQKEAMKSGMTKIGLGMDGLGRKGKRTPSARNMAVAKVMRERGVSLPEASRIVKAEGLA